MDPTSGHATHIGAHIYRPTQHLRDQITTLSPTCRMAGCRQPSWRCELDHLHPFNHTQPTTGGSTDLHNTIPLCKFHHLLKHHTAYTPHLQPDLTITWTTPTGHTATSHPHHFTLPDEEPPPPCPPRTITGPTIAGPTLPLRIDPDYQEPHTEVEDPDTIPHPASAQIHRYRTDRAQLREHTQRRIRRLTTLHQSTPDQPIPPRTTPVTDFDHRADPTDQKLSRAAIEDRFRTLRQQRSIRISTVFDDPPTHDVDDLNPHRHTEIGRDDSQLPEEAPF